MKKIKWIFCFFSLVAFPFFTYSLPGEKIALIVSSENFNDTEFLETQNLLTQNNYQTIIISSQPKIKGMSGLVKKTDILLQDFKQNEFSALVFIGGTGCQEYYDNSFLHKAVRDAVGRRKIVAAICLAPIILSRSGVLKSLSCTAHPSAKGELIKNGAHFKDQDVILDSFILTANGPESSSKFAKTLIEILNSPWRSPAN